MPNTFWCTFHVHNNLIGRRNVERMKNAKAKHTLDLTILLRKFRKVTGALSAFKPEAVDKRSKTDKCEIVRVKFMCKARGYKPQVKETVEAER